jgi:naphthoate synthase
MLKFAMNLTDDGMVGQQVLQVKPRDWPMTEATEGRNAFLEKVSQKL